MRGNKLDGGLASVDNHEGAEAKDLSCGPRLLILSLEALKCPVKELADAFKHTVDLQWS